MSDHKFTEQDQKERDRIACDIVRKTGRYPSMTEIDAVVWQIDAGMRQIERKKKEDIEQ